MANDRDTTIEEFGNAVNMTRKELGDWLKTDESRGVGQKRAGDDESTGHESGRMIVKLLAKKASRRPLQRRRRAADAPRRQLRPPPPRSAPQRRRRAHSLALLSHELGARPTQVVDSG
jgi:hypothetical protein